MEKSLSDDLSRDTKTMEKSLRLTSTGVPVTARALTFAPQMCLSW
jgi:hypothetical protein